MAPTIVFFHISDKLYTLPLWFNNKSRTHDKYIVKNDRKYALL